MTISRPQVAALLAERSAANAASLVQAFGPPPAYAWAVYLSTPFSLNASKNRRWSNTGHGSVFLTAKVRAYQDTLIADVRRALNGTAVCNAKLWIGLFVQKPNHRSDAINVVDTICDAIKKAVDLDDRWFCLDRLDWEIVKKDPRIFIRIAQEDVEDRIACSHCGQILTLEKFSKNKSGPLARSRACLECSRIIDAARSVKGRMVTA